MKIKINDTEYTIANNSFTMHNGRLMFTITDEINVIEFMKDVNENNATVVYDGITFPDFKFATSPSIDTDNYHVSLNLRKE